MIRRYGAADAAVFHGFRLSALRAAPAAFGDDAARWGALGAAAVADWLASYRCFVAHRDGAPVGMAAWEALPWRNIAHRGQVVSVYVDRAARGRGVGDALMAALVADAAPQVAQLELGVGALNAPARALYRRNGFVEIGREPRALRVDGVWIDEVRMWRPLGKAARAS